jgi:hypothetical protein
MKHKAAYVAICLLVVLAMAGKVQAQKDGSEYVEYDSSSSSTRHVNFDNLPSNVIVGDQYSQSAGITFSTNTPYTYPIRTTFYYYGPSPPHYISTYPSVTSEIFVNFAL